MKRVYIVLCLCLLLGGLIPLVPGTALAQGGSSSNQLELAVRYPKVNGIAGDTFTFEVGIRNRGTVARDFSLVVTAPPQWSTYITPSDDTSKKISALRLAPTGETDYVQFISVSTTPPTQPVVARENIL